MTSNVDASVPAGPVARTRDVRRNFAIIKAEIEALQLLLTSTATNNNPQFTGLMVAESALFSGDFDIEGVLSPSEIAPLQTSTPAKTPAGVFSNVVGGPTFTLQPSGRIDLSGVMTFDYTVMATGTGYQLCAIGALPVELCPPTDYVVPCVVLFGGVSFRTAMISVSAAGFVGFAWTLDASTATTNITGVGALAYFTGSYIAR